MSEYHEQIHQFYEDLAKLQNDYNYESRGHGSINIYTMDEDGRVVACVNWSSCGDQTTKWAKAFAEALIEAINACERFNSTHKLDDTVV